MNPLLLQKPGSRDKDGQNWTRLVNEIVMRFVNADVTGALRFCAGLKVGSRSVNELFVFFPCALQTARRCRISVTRRRAPSGAVPPQRAKPPRPRCSTAGRLFLSFFLFSLSLSVAGRHPRIQLFSFFLSPSFLPSFLLSLSPWHTIDQRPTCCVHNQMVVTLSGRTCTCNMTSDCFARYTRNVRTQDQIEAAGAYERPQFQPQPDSE